MWDALQRGLAGEVILPGSPGYEDARKPALARFHDSEPAAVVRCAAAEDVAETIGFARRAELPFAARSGGHDFAGRSSTPGIVIDVSPLAEIAFAGDVATIGAGARLGDVYTALAAHGRTIAAGCGPEVGVAGLVLGGGLGILGRAHGTTSDQLLGAQVVLPDGRVVGCDEHHDEDLFWALRGAGHAGVGVATSFAFRTLPAPHATSFRLTWPHAAAAAVIDAWQHWAPDAPDELAASALLTPDGVHLFGAMAGAEQDAAALLEQFVGRAGADPAASQTTHLPYLETQAAPGRVRARRRRRARPRVLQVGVLPRPAAGRGRHGARRPLRRPGGRRRDADARLLTLGRRLQPRAPPTRPRSCTAATASCSSTR